MVVVEALVSLEEGSTEPLFFQRKKLTVSTRLWCLFFLPPTAAFATFAVFLEGVFAIFVKS